MFTGRQFGCDRALSILQDEDYLKDSDYDQIRRYDILGKIEEFDPNVNIPKKRQQWKMGAKSATPYKKRHNSRVGTVIMELNVKVIFRYVDSCIAHAICLTNFFFRR